MPFRAMAFIAVIIAAGCSDDPNSAVFASERPYANLSDFDTAGCSRVDLTSLYGIWHFRVIGPESEARGTLAVRFGPDRPRRENLWSEAGEPAAWFAGTQANRLLFGDGVLVRVQVDNFGSLNSWSLFGCHTDDPNRLSGSYALCTDDQCETYEAEGYRVSDLGESPSAKLQLISEFSGPLLEKRAKDQIWINVRYRDGYAYAVRRDWLFIVDVSNPSAPVQVGRAPLIHGNDVKLTVGNDGVLYALTSSDRAGIHVFDVSEPSRPTEVLRFATEFDPEAELVRGVHTLFIENDRAYITQQGVKVYDIGDPKTPQLLGHYALTPDGYVHDMYVADGIVYLNYWSDGLVVVDMNDPSAPVKLGQFNDYDDRTSHSNWVTRAGGRLVSVHGDESVGAHVRIVDVDPASPTFMQAIGRYQTQAGVSVHNIQAHGELAFVTYYQDGLRVLDLSDPTRPVEVAHFRTWMDANESYGSRVYEGAIGIDYDPDTRTAYVVDTHRGLLLLHLDEDLEPDAAATGCSVVDATPGNEWLLLFALLVLISSGPRRRGWCSRSGAGTR